jgi:hypothetical protein
MKSIPMECKDFTPNNRTQRLDTTKQFVEEFVQLLAPPKDVDESCEAWTKAVRERFDLMCPDDSEFVPRKSAGTKEYLVDFAWLEMGQGGRVLLACESEWASDSYGRHTFWGYVEEDFEKLLAVKAPFKVLIFSSTAKHLRTDPDPKIDFTIEYAKKRLESSLANYSHNLAGENYIFIDFPATGEPGGNGRFEAFAWIANRCGKAEVKWEPLGNGELNRVSSC